MCTYVTLLPPPPVCRHACAWRSCVLLPALQLRVRRRRMCARACLRVHVCAGTHPAQGAAAAAAAVHQARFSTALVCVRAWWGACVGGASLMLGGLARLCVLLLFCWSLVQRGWAHLSSREWPACTQRVTASCVCRMCVCVRARCAVGLGGACGRCRRHQRMVPQHAAAGSQAECVAAGLPARQQACRRSQWWSAASAASALLHAHPNTHVVQSYVSLAGMSAQCQWLGHHKSPLWTVDASRSIAFARNTPQ
jgi:hypothetical protein